MNKKGFTTVELIVSFVLVVTIAIFLFQIVIILKNIYVESSFKTEIMIKQSNLSNLIYTSFDDGINTISCDTNSVTFTYKDDNTKTLSIDKENNLISFGSYTTSLIENTYFQDLSTNIIYSNESMIFKMIIPIKHDKYNDNFDINIVYPLNSDILIEGC